MKVNGMLTSVMLSDSGNWMLSVCTGSSVQETLVIEQYSVVEIS